MITVSEDVEDYSKVLAEQWCCNPRNLVIDETKSNLEVSVEFAEDELWRILAVSEFS